jgi:competence protein ComEC
MALPTKWKIINTGIALTLVLSAFSSGSTSTEQKLIEQTSIQEQTSVAQSVSPTSDKPKLEVAAVEEDKAEPSQEAKQTVPVDEGTPITGEMKVHFIAVGQGDSIFVELPDGLTMLVDAGPSKASSTVTSYIGNLGYDRIDFLVATHPHEDHIGGIPAVLAGFDIGEIWAPRVNHTTKTYENFLDAIRVKGMNIQTATAGKKLITESNLSIEIISPPASATYTDLNDWSAILKIDYGDDTFLLAGDASKSTIASAVSSHVDVLKVAHHGSKTGTDYSLMQRISPTFSVITVGSGNQYGHPAQSTLSALASTKVYRTDVQGTIIATSDGHSVKFNVDSFDQTQIVEPKQPVKETTPKTDPTPPPTSFETNETIVYITNTGAKYHRGTCRYLSQSKIETTLSDAQANGYEACKVCKPPQ